MAHGRIFEFGEAIFIHDDIVVPFIHKKMGDTGIAGLVLPVVGEAMEQMKGANVDVAEFGCDPFEVGVVFRPGFYGDGCFESFFHPEVRHGIVEEVMGEEHIAIADDGVRIQSTQAFKCFSTERPCEAGMI